VVGHDEVERLAKVISTRHGQTLLLMESVAEGSSEVIRLGESHPHLLAEPEQRRRAGRPPVRNAPVSRTHRKRQPPCDCEGHTRSALSTQRSGISPAASLTL
jgi:hypothetical protein